MRQFALLILLAFGVLFSFFSQSIATDSAGVQDAPIIYGHIEGFRFTDSTGAEVTYDDVRGKIVVLNFFFSRCKGICPTLNGNVKRVVRKFSKDKSIRFLSVSVDPKHDTTEKLASYRKSFEAPAQWQFLRGPHKEVKDFIGEQLKLVSGDTPDVHTTRITLLDQKGRIRGYFRGLESEGIHDLISTIKQLKKEQ